MDYASDESTGDHDIPERKGHALRGVSSRHFAAATMRAIFGHISDIIVLLIRQVEQKDTGRIREEVHFRYVVQQILAR